MLLEFADIAPFCAGCLDEPLKESEKKHVKLRQSSFLYKFKLYR